MLANDGLCSRFNQWADLPQRPVFGELGQLADVQYHGLVCGLCLGGQLQLERNKLTSDVFDVFPDVLHGLL